MALKGTRFHGTAVSYRVIYQGDANATLNKNVADVDGTLKSVIVETGVKSDAYLKLFDGSAPIVGTSTPQLIFRCPKGMTQVFELPSGFAFTNLHFWATKNANPLDVINPESTTKVTLLVG
jgi:hypothetical protein